MSEAVDVESGDVGEGAADEADDGVGLEECEDELNASRRRRKDCPGWSNGKFGDIVSGADLMALFLD